jgi:hypothetical protein
VNAHIEWRDAKALLGLGRSAVTIVVRRLLSLLVWMCAQSVPFARAADFTDTFSAAFENTSWVLLSGVTEPIRVSASDRSLGNVVTKTGGGGVIAYFIDQGDVLTAQITGITRRGATVGWFSPTRQPGPLRAVVAFDVRLGAAPGASLWWAGAAWPTRTLVSGADGYQHTSGVAIAYDLSVDFSQPGFEEVTIEITFTTTAIP